MADKLDEAQKGEQADGEPLKAAFWHSQLASAAKREDNWRKVAQEVVCRYLDDRDHYQAEKDDSRRVNILWSTTETAKGMLFSKLGKPDVGRLFNKPGRENKTARTCALVLERTMVACNNRYDPDVEIEDAVEDQQLPGRGTCWLEYNPTVEEVTEMVGGVDPDTGAERQEEKTSEKITYQEVTFTHVDWADFRHGSAKAWRDVPWVARPLLYTKEDLERDYEDHAEKIPLNYVILDGDGEKKASDTDDLKRARLWEIWYKPKKIRVIVADDYPVELRRDDDPYRLQGFFPTPKPLYAVRTASTLVPRPEFLQWQDQAAELDRCNTRIWRLLERMKYCGIYDASDGENKDILANLGNLKDGEFIGVKNLKALAEGNGLAGAFQVRDLAPIALAIQALATRMVQLLQHIYEVVGVSDVMRGASDPMETLGAQNLKARFGSQRQQKKQKDVQRFVRALYRMKAEIVAEHFEREQLEEMSGIRLPLAADRDKAKQVLKMGQQAQQMAQQAQQTGQQAPANPLAQLEPEDLEELQEIAKSASWEEVSKVLRSDDRRNYKVDVETDMSLLEESEAEKGQRLEFMRMMGEILGDAIKMSTGNPLMANLMRELIMHTMRAFKTGRTLEEVVEDTFTKLGAMPPPQQGAAADPITALEEKKLQAVVKEKELGIKAKQVDLQFKEQDHALDLKAKQEDLAMTQQISGMKHEVELQKQQTAILKEQLAKQTAMLEAMQARFNQQQPPAAANGAAA